MASNPLSRRQLLLGAASLGLSQNAIAGEPFEVRDVVVAGSRATGRRFTLLVPRHTTGPVPLVVAFHGKGETLDETLGVRAWLDRYGLASSYARLLTPPVLALDKKLTHWTAARVAEVNAELLRRPFGGVAVACPFTPDVFNVGGRRTFLDDYARWVTEEVVPRARRETAILEGATHVGVDGVSLGGFVSLEIFLRRPEHFGALGVVQGALGGVGAGGYARALADAFGRVGPRRLHLETSLGDGYRADTEALSRALTKLAVTHDFIAPPGGHNQPFLRDSGTLEMLLWHDRALRS